MVFWGTGVWVEIGDLTPIRLQPRRNSVRERALDSAREPRRSAASCSRGSLAFETKLASRSFVPFLRDLRANGYHVHLVFLALLSTDMAVARVNSRVRSGGHHVPETDIRRRFTQALNNLLHRYREVVDTWELLDNTDLESLYVIAEEVNGR